MRMRHLRNRLILASLIIALPLVIRNVVIQVDRYDEHQNRTIAFHEILADHVAAEFQDHISHVAALDRSIGAALLTDGIIPRRERADYMGRVVRASGFIYRAVVTDRNGMIIVSNLPGLTKLDGPMLASVHKAVRLDTSTLSDVFVPKPFGTPMVTLSTAIRDSSGVLRGVIVVFIDRANMQKAIAQDTMLGASPNLQAVVTDSKGYVYITSDKTTLSPSQSRWSQVTGVRQALAGKTYVAQHMTIPNGRVMMGVSRPVTGLGWTISVFEPRYKIISPYRRALLTNILLAVFIAGLTIGLAVFVGNRFAKPITDLAITARAFGKGDLSARAEIQTGDELELLANSFNEMASELQQRTEELNSTLAQESEQRQTASALYLIAQGIIVNTHLNSRLEIIAQALASICGAKRCVIFLRRDETLIPITGWGLKFPHRFPALSLELDGGSALIHKALLSGTPILVEDAEHDARVPAAISAEYAAMGFLALPLVRRQHLVGLAIVDNPGEYPHFNQEAINTARGLSTLAAIAIENSESFEKWVKIGEAFQGAMLPVIPSKVGKFALASSYYAAIQTAELGGDFYDLIEFPDGRIGLVIADVSGKGLEAAVFTAMGKYTIRAYASEDPNPACVLTRANKTITGSSGEMGFVTMFYGLLDPANGRLMYSVAGHPPPLVISGRGEVTWLPIANHQPPLGILDFVQYEQAEYDLKVNETLVCYTDGIIEARREGETFDIEGLADILGTCFESEPRLTADVVHTAVLEFSHGIVQDDIALLIAKHTNV